MRHCWGVDMNSAGHRRRPGSDAPMVEKDGTVQRRAACRRLLSVRQSDDAEEFNRDGLHAGCPHAGRKYTGRSRRRTRIISV